MVIVCVVFSTALVANDASYENGVKGGIYAYQSSSSGYDTYSDVRGLKDAFDSPRITKDDLEVDSKYTTSAESIIKSTVDTEKQLSNIHTLQVVQLIVSRVTCVVISGLGIIFIINMRGNKSI